MDNLLFPLNKKSPLQQYFSFAKLLWIPPSLPLSSSTLFLPAMGNKMGKQEKDDVILLKIIPPVDQAYAKWLARDVERLHRFVPKRTRAVKPPDHYVEYMKLNGLLDLDLDDPDLAHLFK